MRNTPLCSISLNLQEGLVNSILSRSQIHCGATLGLRYVSIVGDDGCSRANFARSSPN
jgi:hypothetical protein